MIVHYFTIVLRGLIKYKWQNVVCVVGLTIGLTAFVLGGYWWYWERHFDDFHPHSRYVYAITTTGISTDVNGVPTELNQLHRDDVNWMLENIPEIEKSCCIHWAMLQYKADDKSENVTGLYVDSSFFSMFYAGFIDGDYKYLPFDGSHIVLTERAAMNYFGKTDCAGEVFPGANKIVAGVIKNYPANSEFRFEFLSLSPSVYNNMGRTTFYVQLNRHAHITDVREKVENHKSVAQLRFDQGAEKNWSFNLRTLPEIHLNCNKELKSRFRNINLMAIAGLLGLISALMSHLTLFIGLQLKRQRRNNTFRSMGATGSYLFTKSLIDLLIPLFFAIVASVCLIRFLFPFYQYYTQWQGEALGIFANYVNKPEFKAMIHTAIEWSVFIFALFLLAGSLVIVGLIGKVGKQTPYLLRRGLIVSQAFIGSFFLFTALSLYKQFHFTANKDRGIRIENIIQINSVAGNGFDNYPIIRDELLRSPYIDDVTFTTMPVLTETGESYINFYTSLTLGGERFGGVGVFMVEPNFLDFFGMKMKEGEWISGETDVVVNEQQMQSFGEQNPLRETINVGFFGEKNLSGIVTNYNYSTMQFPYVGLVFHLFNKEALEPYRCAYIKTKPQNRAFALEHMQKVLEEQQIGHLTEGDQVFALSDVMNRLNRPEKMLSLIFGILSLACILVVSLGVYALISLTIEQRHREIAIRKVNGAEFADMLRLFFHEYLILVSIGNMFALTLGYFLMLRWFETYAYRTALSWWLFALTLVTTTIIVFLSVVSKIKVAAQVEPAEALKYD